MREQSGIDMISKQLDLGLELLHVVDQAFGGVGGLGVGLEGCLGRVRCHRHRQCGQDMASLLLWGLLLQLVFIIVVVSIAKCIGCCFCITMSINWEAWEGIDCSEG